jgi:hypothetical protein
VEQVGRLSPIDRAQRPGLDTENVSAGDTFPEVCEIIEVRVSELRQLFNAIDPSPFHERELDPRAEQFIVDWASGVPRDAKLALLVHLDRGAGGHDETVVLREAIHEFFSRRATEARRRLHELFHRGRVSLLIAIAFLALALTVSDRIGSYFPESRLALLVREGALIVGWVALWRPVEVFLYDWWPIQAEIRLLERLTLMPVRIAYRQTAPADAWRADWPAMRASTGPTSSGAALASWRRS